MLLPGPCVKMFKSLPSRKRKPSFRPPLTVHTVLASSQHSTRLSPTHPFPRSRPPSAAADAPGAGPRGPLAGLVAPTPPGAPEVSPSWRRGFPLLGLILLGRIGEALIFPRSCQTRLSSESPSFLRISAARRTMLASRPQPEAAAIESLPIPSHGGCRCISVQPRQPPGRLHVGVPCTPQTQPAQRR